MEGVFKIINRFFMVPAYRMGLAWLVCNPVTGYIMVIKNIGRRSGKLYYTPTNYAIMNGNIYCVAGFGQRSSWYLNLMAHPRAEVMLPGRAVMGEIEEVSDPNEALQAIRQVFKNAGFAGFFEGYNPWIAPDDKFIKTLEHTPVLRIKPVGIGSGPMDAGGWHWVAWVAAAAALIVLIR